MPIPGSAHRVPGRPPAWLGAAGYVAFFVAVGSGYPYLPVFYQSLGLDFGAVGLLAALAAATGLVAGPAWGAVADRFARSGATLPLAAVLSAIAATALWVVGTALPDGSWRLVAVALVALALAAALGGIGPQLDARAVETVGGDRTGYGRLRAWGSASFIATAAVAGPILDRTGPAGLFAFYVPALLVTAWIGARLPRTAAGSATVPTAPVRAGRLLHGLRELLAVPRVRLFLVGSLVGWAALTGVNAFLSVDLVALGAPAGAVGLAWAAGALLEVPIMWRFPDLARRFGAERLIVAGPLVLAIRALACAVAPTPPVLVGFSILQGVGYALSYVGGVAWVARAAPSGRAATAQGVYGGATVGLGQILGGGIGGALVGPLGLSVVFALSGLASVVAAALLGRAVGARWRRPPRDLVEAT